MKKFEKLHNKMPINHVSMKLLYDIMTLINDIKKIVIIVVVVILKVCFSVKQNYAFQWQYFKLNLCFSKLKNGFSTQKSFSHLKLCFPI